MWISCYREIMRKEIKYHLKQKIWLPFPSSAFLPLIPASPPSPPPPPHHKLDEIFITLQGRLLRILSYLRHSITVVISGGDGYATSGVVVADTALVFVVDVSGITVILEQGSVEENRHGRALTRYAGSCGWCWWSSEKIQIEIQNKNLNLNLNSNYSTGESTSPF